MSQSPNVVAPPQRQRQGNHSLNFADVFDEYQRPIYNYLLRLTEYQAEAEDLAQETFIRVHRSLPIFRGEASLSTHWRLRTSVVQARSPRH